jgi:cytochrome b subunit of formate dehydrogenase
MRATAVRRHSGRNSRHGVCFGFWIEMMMIVVIIIRGVIIILRGQGARQ